MREDIQNPMTLIVRASGEATLAILVKQLQNQLKKNDVLKVIDNDDCFEIKMQQGFDLAVEIDNPITVFIDADILIRYGTLKKIRFLSKTLKPNELGFGVLLWDRFYDRPKLRGVHVYQTKHLSLAKKLIPNIGTTIRPETKMKSLMANKGIKWLKFKSSYIGGVHDFGQYLYDIYYKYLIRSNRANNKERNLLYKKFNQKRQFKEFEIALKALEYGKDKFIKNDKKIYLADVDKENLKKTGYTPKNINFYIISKTIRRYSVSRKFIYSNF